ncbi:PTS ascorbate transporter subunit IIC [Desertibacillus haloalkaliphilus]|uniref:PTS ascorbate transporter subunit IIC n=1 Tax=Desertibacillus haloalkaliphilus TaxID=1328930 RepID=UPI001C26BE11|nr:PTS ascorbate transporter subunit IIC [Desertibacillus haloalkaliphilus]MBU8905571.1 PTS ascorbate transporter subunit IIC [Desertibacillus haloalkaliphilus]
MESLGNVWDFSFFWNVFGFLLQLVAPFVMIIVAIIAVGLLLAGVIYAIRNRN